MIHATFTAREDVLDYTRVAMQVGDYRDYLVMLDRAMAREIRSRNQSRSNEP